MLFRLGNLIVELEGDDRRIEDYWRDLVGSFAVSAENHSVSMRVTLHLVDSLPPLPADPAYFSDSVITEGRSHILDAYHINDSHAALHFLDGALVIVPVLPERDGDVPHIIGWITNHIFDTGRFEDVVLVSLAPSMRQRGYFLVHAAGVTWNNHAVLLVGPSGSGKTTTCLTLLDAGWQLLSNDVVLLQRHNGQVWAWPVPDTVTIRPKTWQLLPHLTNDYHTDYKREQSLPARLIVDDQWATPAPVTALCFPHVTPYSEPSLEPQASAHSLARLLEESLDSWDTATLNAHMAVLAAITDQAALYRLHLGMDVTTLPHLLQAAMPAAVTTNPNAA